MQAAHAFRRGGRQAPPPEGLAADPAGFAGVRFVVDDQEATWVSRFLRELPRAGPPGAEPLRLLALSGGGAGGSFGAGALVGLSSAGSRPTFDMVTGVSTGALIAPFAFLGSSWDAQLTHAYTGELATELLALSGVRPGASLYPAERLTALVRRYLDERLLEAVAAAHAEGRRLFVATANLDAQTTSIWDMGRIASVGGPAALKLFEDILVASTSLPGVFPPKMIAVSGSGEAYEEMHVDGGAISPLFVVPQTIALTRSAAWAAAGVEVYALINTTLRPSPKATPMGALPVLVRSFELVLRSSYRNAVQSIAAFCEINDFELFTACVPEAFGGASMLRFEREFMTRMFEAGHELAQSGKLWTNGRRGSPTYPTGGEGGLAPS